jgi:hypothetical protein
MMSVSSISLSGSAGLHIICERDVGIFSLIQQVISNIPWALREGRIPIACFQERTCYCTPKGYRDSDTVWEYYFDPIVLSHPVSSIPEGIRRTISLNPPRSLEAGYFADQHTFVTCNFGDHADLNGKTLLIPWRLEDPDDAVRRKASEVIRAFVHPRAYICDKADRFFREHMNGRYVIGVHVRGTDAVSKQEMRPHRQGSLQLPKYVKEMDRLLKAEPGAMIFVASDAQSSVDHVKDVFGSRVITYDSIRHLSGEAAGKGPAGGLLPGYIAQDRDVAARNGEEAVVEYLLLSRCNYLVHNGSSLARTVLLKAPELPHTNTYAVPPRSPTWLRRTRRRLHWTLSRLRNSGLFTTELFDAGQFKAGWPDWHRNGQVVMTPDSGEAKVTLADTLARIVPINDSFTYRYSLEAFSAAPGSLVRLQVDWHDASGTFMQTTIETRQCGLGWLVYSEDMTPPLGAKTGMVIVGGHSSAPVLVRSVSLKYAVCGMKTASPGQVPHG